MKPASFFAFSLLLTPALLSAQYTPQSGFAVACMQSVDDPKPCPAPNVESCPIGLRAQHLSDGDIVKTDLAHPKGIGQALHLTLSGNAHGPIASATVLFRGMTPRDDFAQVAATNQPPTTTRSQHVQFKASTNAAEKSKSMSSANIWVSGFSSIASVEVVYATYSDGTTFTPSADLICRVTPELLMPVRP